ncbi:hypothetical protein KP509_23G054700 [Ceratopteris richardii]|uniref:EMC1 first beta-propeller domain-containing protein n=1 Tax=Ceratopteris richardii TaxID=49495 RepID=A0A8T2S1U0_CERRI|nr:hypothetical protein KP509_23G054700 [Ceratopteris richardii]
MHESQRSHDLSRLNQLPIFSTILLSLGMACPLLLVPWSLLLFYVIIMSHSLIASREHHGSSWHWHHKYVGRVKHAAYHTFPMGRKILLVATEKNILASLDIRNGRIVWRRVLEADDKINGLGTSENYVVTLSGLGTLRAWNFMDGELIWETRFPRFSFPPTLDVKPIEIHHLKAKIITVLEGPRLYGVSDRDGQIIWRTNHDIASNNGTFSLKKVFTGEDMNSLFGVGFIGTSGFCVWKIYLLTGRLVMNEAGKIDADICTDEILVTRHTVVALDCEGKIIFTGHIGPVKIFHIHRTPVRNIIPDAFGKARLLKSGLEGIFVLRFIDQIVFIKICNNDHDLEIVEIFELPAAISNGLELPGNKASTLLIQHVGLADDCKIAARFITAGGEEYETFSHILDLDCDRGLVQQVHLSGYVRRNKSWGFQALLVMEDDSMMFLQNNKLVWSRDEGLAEIAAVVAEDLPSTKKLEVKELTSTSSHWLKGLMTVLKGSAGSSIEQDKRGRFKLERDPDGIRKLLLVLTSEGKLFAFHSCTGKIVWSLLIPSFRKSSRRSKATVLKLLPCHYSSELKETTNPMVLVIGNFGSKACSSGILSWVDSYRGIELHSTRIPLSIVDTISSEIRMPEPVHVHILLDVKKNIHVFPACLQNTKALEYQNSSLIFPVNDMHKVVKSGYTSNASLDGLHDAENPSSIRFPVIDMDKNIISGYTFDASSEVLHDAEIPYSLTFKSKKVWEVDFLKSERILATSRINEVAISNSDLYGPMNNVMTIVATLHRPVPDVSASVSSGESTVTIYLMDTMTGKLLYQIQHLNAQGPVHMVQDGDWFAYCFLESRTLKCKYSSLKILETDCEGFKNASITMNADAARHLKRCTEMIKLDTLIDVPSLRTLGIVKGITERDRWLFFGAHDGQIQLFKLNHLKHMSKRDNISKHRSSLGVPVQEIYRTSTGIFGLLYIKLAHHDGHTICR